MTTKIAILGATGYTGLELLRLLSGHPAVEIAFASSERSAGLPVSRVHPQLTGIVDQKLEPLVPDQIPSGTKLAFLALPHGSSAAVVPELLSRGITVIDLSADYRLQDPALYDQWYGRSHPAPQWLGRAVYGLPELHAAAIKETDLVANPGCYPTSVLLALAPLAARGVVDWNSVVIDAKSGVSGAGRTPRQAFHFPDCAENLKAYRIEKHHHIPEIEQELANLAQEAVTVTFTPHLVPMVRGILSTVYLRLKPQHALSEEKLTLLYEEFYCSCPFVRLHREVLPETRLVRGSNFCDLALRREKRTGRVIVLAAIDNLVKGASGQAVQNMNLILGLPQETGLSLVPA